MAEASTTPETEELTADLLPERSSAPVLYLVFCRGGRTSRLPGSLLACAHRIPLRIGTWTLGRTGNLPSGGDAEVVAERLREDGTLSGAHATLRVLDKRSDGLAGPSLRLRDGGRLGDGGWRASRNHTFVNGCRLVDERELEDGDVLRLGGSLFVLRLGRGGEVEAVAPEELGDSGFVGVSREIAALRARIAASARTARAPTVPPRLGLLRSADGGVVFLDEIGSLPLAQQGALLLFLDDGTVLPVGARDAARRAQVATTVIAATNEDLGARVRSGEFRRDLLERFFMRLSIPPLRERREDVLILARGFGLEATPEGLVLTADAAEALLLHGWAGNVRELRRVVAELADRRLGEIDLGALPPAIHEELVRRRRHEGPALPVPADPREPRQDPVEREVPSAEALRGLLERHVGNVSAIARESGWSRRQILRFLADHGLDAGAFRSSDPS
jgi:two-component system response regulator HydG